MRIRWHRVPLMPHRTKGFITAGILVGLASPLLSCSETIQAVTPKPPEIKPEPCSIVHYRAARNGKAFEVRVKENPDIVAGTIDKEFWGVSREPSIAKQYRNRYGEELAPWTDDQIAHAIHKTYYFGQDRDEFVAQATRESVKRVRRSGRDLVLIGGETYLPRNTKEILAIKGC